MKWTKVSLETTTQAMDLVTNMLNELGIEGIEIEDKIPITEEEKKALYIDILPEILEDDGIAKVSFYLEEEQNVHEIIDQINEQLESLKQFVNVGTGEITVLATDDNDWLHNWKQFFKPFRLEENIVIKPTWEILDDQKEDDIVVEIDSGTAFGTGSHETTKLCIQGLKQYLKEEHEVLDIGCGSGILSIIAVKLLAKKVCGIDIDPIATDIAKENTEINNITEDKLKVLCGNIIDNSKLQEGIKIETYDIVLSNILADVIILLAPIVGKYMKKDAVWITSGIINTKEEEVKEVVLENGFTIQCINKMGEWVSIVARKV